jgi:hypothetical protein
VIYYWLRDDGQIYMLLIYPKSKKDDLTDRETALLRESGCYPTRASAQA